MLLFQADPLRKLSVKMFTVAGASEEQAETVTDVLMGASLHGIDSHGVRALPSRIRWLTRGRVRPDAEITVLNLNF